MSLAAQKLKLLEITSVNSWQGIIKVQNNFWKFLRFSLIAFLKTSKFEFWFQRWSSASWAPSSSCWWPACACLCATGRTSTDREDTRTSRRTDRCKQIHQNNVQANLSVKCVFNTKRLEIITKQIRLIRISSIHSVKSSCT